MPSRPAAITRVRFPALLRQPGFAAHAGIYFLKRFDVRLISCELVVLWGSPGEKYETANGMSGWLPVIRETRTR